MKENVNELVWRMILVMLSVLMLFLLRESLGYVIVWSIIIGVWLCLIIESFVDIIHDIKDEDKSPEGEE